ncbi:MAG: PilW family protein [Planctomycetota bacterium]|jgi:prepilin-type N-terminal cleavage/methylation domain-containing protein
MNTNAPQSRRVQRARRSGMSVIELLIALSISAVLLTALAVATSSSFHAYATAAESASSQSVSRLVMQRMLQMIRGGRLHDAYDPGDPNLALNEPAQDPVNSVGLQMLDNNGTLLRIWWAVDAEYFDNDLGNLWYQEGNADPQPLIRRVRVQRDSNEPYVFSLASRDSEEGLLLSRATIDLTVEPAVDRTLALERNRTNGIPIRLVASTMPRRNLEQ